jgi:glycerol kinase
MKYILALDQGTTSSRAILYNEQASMVDVAQEEFNQFYPKSGWVEHDPEEILSSQLSVAHSVLKNLNEDDEVQSLGITNQRETTIIWDKNTGKPIANAIVWQDRRTASYCDKLRQEGHETNISNKTGLILDAYFSASKINWLLENVPGAREKANNDELLFGTVDSWLIWNLTKGKNHVTDVSNASRTMLYNIHELSWDEELLELFNIPGSMMPTVKDSSDQFGKAVINEREIPITGIAGDQQAALFGQMCLEKEMAKCTYGTGCFFVMNTGQEPVKSENKLLTTIAWRIDNKVTYALEGSVFVGGAIIQWLRDGLDFFSNAEDSEGLANEVEDTDGVVFVPALTGLGAPHWDSSARGAILGISRGTKKAHIGRAALESIALQVNDLLITMEKDSGKAVQELRVDGGATANNLLMQMQADYSSIPVIRPKDQETTALGAAFLAGIGCGLWNMNQLKKIWEQDKVFTSEINEDIRVEKLDQWNKAVAKSKNWIE